METKTQDNEKAQLLQTVEMFEAVTQANPDDYQSLEILREAYVKLGRDAEGLRVSKQIARAHQNVGQVSQAILQYEGILQQNPQDEEAKSLLNELQATAMAAGGSKEAPAYDPEPDLALSSSTQSMEKDGNELLCDLIVKRAGRLRQTFADPDGDEVLAEMIVKHGLLKEKDVLDVLHAVQGQNKQLTNDAMRTSLVQGFSDRGLLAPEQLMAFITEKTNLAFLPLSICDVVPDIVHLQPRDISFKYGTLAFDRISRTLLMATSNPFDERAKKASQKVLDYSLQWYVCYPQEITQILKDVYLVGKANTKDD